MKDTYSILTNLILQEKHGPGTIIGDYLAGKSATWLLNCLKQCNHSVYEAVERAIEEEAKKKHQEG